MRVADDWKDYELLDCSDGERLERWGEVILIRPDPQVIWKTPRKHPMWKKANARYLRSSTGGGHWEILRKTPDAWRINYKELSLNVKTMGFKHTGLFPEQAANWDWFSDLISRRTAAGGKAKVLNLFAYTGGATVAAAHAGASVCHVDASKGMVAQAKQNAALSGLGDAPIRYIVDDCQKFVEREIRRGNRYDGIIMDPPSYGRGPTGEVWKIEDSVDGLVRLATSLLSEKPLFFLINSYTTGLSPLTMKYILDRYVTDKCGGVSEASELALPVRSTGGLLPAGASARWCAE